MFRDQPFIHQKLHDSSPVQLTPRVMMCSLRLPPPPKSPCPNRPKVVGQSVLHPVVIIIYPIADSERERERDIFAVTPITYAPSHPPPGTSPSQAWVGHASIVHPPSTRHHQPPITPCVHIYVPAAPASPARSPASTERHIHHNRSFVRSASSITSRVSSPTLLTL